MIEVAAQTRSLLRQQGLSSQQRTEVFLSALWQELFDQVQHRQPAALSLAEKADMAVELRAEGSRQVEHLPLIRSELHPLQMAQALIGGLEYVLSEELKHGETDDERGVAGSLAYLRMVSEDTRGRYSPFGDALQDLELDPRSLSSETKQLTESLFELEK